MYLSVVAAQASKLGRLQLDGLISLIGSFGGLVSDATDGWLNLKFDSCGLIGGFKS